MLRPRPIPKENPAAVEPLRLLIADDDPDDLELCLRSLESSGIEFQAETVSTKEEFEKRLKERPFDVVLSDYRMKSWTGMDALAMAREIHPEIPLILLSGTLGDEMSVECIKLGVTDYVLALETLTGLGYQVMLATDGEQAVADFRANRDQISLALLDVMLPKLSGPEICAIIRKEKPELAVIFATGYSPDMAQLQKARQEGLPVLQKPYSPRDLARKVRETLDQRVLATPQK